MTIRIDLRLELEYGVLYLTDPYGDEELLDVSFDPVKASENELAFAVTSYLDGAALVTLSDHEPPDAHTMVFSTTVNVGSGVIALADCNRFYWAFLPIDGDRAEVDLWRWDDPRGRAWLHVRNLSADS